MSFQNIRGDIGQLRHIFLAEMLSRRILCLLGAQSVQGCAVLGISGLCNAGCLGRAANHPSLKGRCICDRNTRGRRIYLATPRLRGPLAVNAGVAAAGAMVFVNNVVIIQGGLGLSQRAVVVALASFGTFSGCRIGAAKPLGKPGTLCMTHHGPSTSPNRGGSAAASWLWLQARRTNALVPRSWLAVGPQHAARMSNCCWWGLLSPGMWGRSAWGCGCGRAGCAVKPQGEQGHHTKWRAHPGQIFQACNVYQ